MYIIRKCRIDDYIDIYELNKNEMGYDYPLEQQREKILQLIESPNDKIYVAVAKEKVIGYVHANDYDAIYAPHMKNIMGIAVSGSWQRRGIGRALLNSIENWARQSNAKGIRLVSCASRIEAHAFYRSCGYSEDKLQLNLKKMF